jgi:hypothetical protein
MPLGDFERDVLRLLAVNRNPNSYVAGATVLNQNSASPRTSKDVDVFHDTIESLSQSADRDISTLRTNGFEVIEAGRRHDTFCRALVREGSKQTKIEWAFDSAFRFFPVEPDPDLGWRLNFWDAAVNKVLAFAGRSEVRDWVDILHLHGRHLHLGALAWAGTGKDPGLCRRLSSAGADAKRCIDRRTSPIWHSRSQSPCRNLRNDGWKPPPQRSN